MSVTEQLRCYPRRRAVAARLCSLRPEHVWGEGMVFRSDQGLLCSPGARERVTAKRLAVAVDGAAPENDLVSVLHLMGD